MNETHPAYRTVDRDDFTSMLEDDRYFDRSPAFEEIIARTEEHFWNPEDPDYINLRDPEPLEDSILPEDFIMESQTAVWDRLDEGQRKEFLHDSARWTISQLLHGEQGALSLSSSLCDIFLDPGALMASEHASMIEEFRFNNTVPPFGRLTRRDWRWMPSSAAAT